MDFHNDVLSWESCCFVSGITFRNIFVIRHFPM